MSAQIDIRAYIVGFGDCILLSLPDDTAVYPGHGERTSVGQERRSTPHLR